tara:strand:- start:4196 stop:4681 length:486 start_codon:yes stop_codon:yes gene_type:complete
MKKILVVFVLVPLLYSCTSNTIYKKPKDLIPKDSMILLLKDLYIASSAKSIKNKNLQRKISYIPLVYNLYKIDSLRFNNSNIYYTSRVDDYQPILDQVLVLLKKEQAFFTNIKKVRDSVLQDSLKKNQLKLIEKNKGKGSKIKTISDVSLKKIKSPKKKSN